MKLFNTLRLKVLPRLAPGSRQLSLLEIPGAIEIVDACPRVNWKAVTAACKLLPDSVNRRALWTELGAQWLERLGAHLNGGYKVYEGRQLLMLSAMDPNAVQRLVHFADSTLAQLHQMLQINDKNLASGKPAILILENARVYYDYISYFHPDRERVYATSGGISLSGGYGHVVMYGLPVLSTIAHELAHDSVSHLPLPRWLNEGWAQWAETSLAGAEPPRIVPRDCRLQQRYWSRFGMRGFWDGSAFGSIPSQRLSYQLSRVLFHNLLNHRSRRRQLASFLSCAHRKDSGAAASQQCFQCSPGDLVTEFLGQGPWRYSVSHSETK
ncbi:MAG TPA: hypothetical protein VFC78_06095 [Tepidisphaeraceae bacterium]|nr:hypothetical protein [Tepidisphaeraceae bacterium]